MKPGFTAASCGSARLAVISTRSGSLFARRAQRGAQRRRSPPASALFTSADRRREIVAQRELGERARRRRAEAPRHPIDKPFLPREVVYVLGLDDVARHRVEAAVAVGKPELHALLAGPDEPAEHVGRLLQALAAPFAHGADELLVDVLHQDADVLLVLLALRRERIQHAL